MRAIVHQDCLMLFQYCDSVIHNPNPKPSPLRAHGSAAAMLKPVVDQGGSYTISAKCSGCSVTDPDTIHGVTFGDVWFCFGQYVGSDRSQRRHVLKSMLVLSAVTLVLVRSTYVDLGCYSSQIGETRIHGSRGREKWG